MSKFKWRKHLVVNEKVVHVRELLKQSLRYYIRMF